MMSVLQGLTKKLYFIILPLGRPVSMQNFRLNVYAVYFFDIGIYSLHYNLLSGLIISLSRSKRVNRKIITITQYGSTVYIEMAMGGSAL